MAKLMYVVLCWSTVIIGMETPVIKKYSFDIEYPLEEMRKAEELDRRIQDGDLINFLGDSSEQLNLLIRYSKEQSLKKLLKEHIITPKFQALQEAIASGHVSIAMLFVEQMPTLVNEQNDIGTPLHIASLFNRKDLAQRFLQLGVDINSVNKYRDTALHLAVKKGHEAMVSFLCERGANPFIENVRKYNRRFTPMDMAYHKILQAWTAKELPLMPIEKVKLFRDMLHTMYRCVGRFGGAVWQHEIR